MQETDSRDRDLLHVLQQDIPLVSTPFAVIGQQIDMSEKEVLKRAEKLRREGTIRQIAGVFDTRALGYRSSLVAARVHADDLERAASVVNLHPGVSQNYKRNHDFNLWFSIAVSQNSQLGLERTVEILGEEIGAAAIRLLPTLRLFKHPDADATAESNANDDLEPTEREKEVVRLLQRDVPLLPRPWDAMSTPELSADEILATARTLRQRHQLRRIVATPSVRKGTFNATAMGVWEVPSELAEKAGERMALHRSVLQCFLRPTYPDWPYNIFATVQGRSVDECESILEEISSEVGLQGMRALFPMKEFKRTKIAFFSPEHEVWEAVRTRSDSSASAAS